MNKYTPEQVETLATFMMRWAEADVKANEGSHYKHYQFNQLRLGELVTDFTQDQKQFIQSQLDEAYCNIGYANVLG